MIWVHDIIVTGKRSVVDEVKIIAPFFNGDRDFLQEFGLQPYSLFVTDSGPYLNPLKNLRLIMKARIKVRSNFLGRLQR